MNATFFHSIERARNTLSIFFLRHHTLHNRLKPVFLILQRWVSPCEDYRLWYHKLITGYKWPLILPGRTAATQESRCLKCDTVLCTWVRMPLCLRLVQGATCTHTIVATRTFGGFRSACHHWCGLFLEQTRGGWGSGQVNCSDGSLSLLSV